MTLSRRSLIALTISAVTASGASTIAAYAGPKTMPSRSDDAGGVRVVVQPKSLAPGAAWTFNVTMDTHTKPLDSDLAKSAVLIVGDTRLSPTSWQGDAPGGHHRKGVLSFPAPQGAAGAFSLEIAGIGGSAKRSFHWTAP